MIIYAIDDEKLMLEALTESIREALPQAQVMGFRKPREMLEAYSDKPGDIVFSDIRMTGMDGVALAKSLITIKGDVNIIFITGFDNFKADAMDIYASAYLLKPVTTEKVREALAHLRYPVDDMIHKFRAVTFGNFTLYAYGTPVTFHRKKSAELLAYLVASGGTVVSRSELTLMLYEDETHSAQSRKNLDNAIRTLRDDLAAAEAEDLLYKGSDGLAVNSEILESDFFDFKNGNHMLYQGQFMEQYSWGEYFKSEFEKIRNE